MNENTEPKDWSRQAISAAARIARTRGIKTADVQKESIRKLVKFSARGALYRAKIV